MWTCVYGSGEWQLSSHKRVVCAGSHTLLLWWLWCPWHSSGLFSIAGCSQSGFWRPLTHRLLGGCLSFWTRSYQPRSCRQWQTPEFAPLRCSFCFIDAYICVTQPQWFNTGCVNRPVRVTIHAFFHTCRSRLDTWLTAKGKTPSRFQHLRCFGVELSAKKKKQEQPIPYSPAGLSTVELEHQVH